MLKSTRTCVMKENQTMYKIFLDDIRPAPKETNYNVVRTYKECIMIIDIFGKNIERIDLDYDLGTQNETGYEVLIYMKEHNINPTYINIHSDHPEGARMMVKYAEEYFKNSIISHKVY